MYELEHQWVSAVFENTQAWGIPLSATKRYLRSTVQKYAPAIKRLKEGGLSTAAVAAEFGLNKYLSPYLISATHRK